MLAREAAEGVKERVAAYADYGRSAQRELREYRPSFVTLVAADFALAQKAD